MMKDRNHGITLGIVGQVSGSSAIAIVDSAPQTAHVTTALGMEWRAMSEGGPRARISELLDNLTELLQIRERRELISRTRTLAVAVAGMDVRFSTDLFRESLRILGFREANITITSLAQAAHVGAFLDGPGLLIRCGDDASAFIRPPSGPGSLIGGWSSVVGDRGSGPWLGRKALIAATRILDGNAGLDEDNFISSLSLATGLTGPRSLLQEMEVHRFSSGELGVRQFLCVLGGCTIALAADGDRHAKSLVERSIAQIIEMLRSPVERVVNHGEPIPVCFRGGILEQYSYFCKSLAEALMKAFPSRVLFSPGCTCGFSTIMGTGLIALDVKKNLDLSDTALNLANSISNQRIAFPRKECCLTQCPLI